MLCWWPFNKVPECWSSDGIILGLPTVAPIQQGPWGITVRAVLSSAGAGQLVRYGLDRVVLEQPHKNYGQPDKH